MRVYALIYNTDGRFLIASKPDLKFYKGDGSAGEVFPDGEQLDGAGKYALPAGTGDDGQEMWLAANAFHAQTGATIPGGRQYSVEKFDGFTAVYFSADPVSFQIVGKDVVEKCLPAGGKAARDIESGKIKEYGQIFDRYGRAPDDNELASAEVWNITEDDTWALIRSWDGDADLGRYYQILKILHDHLVTSADPVSLHPAPTRAEHGLAVRDSRRYLRSTGLSPSRAYDPDIADSNGLISYVNATTNEPPPQLVEERKEISAILEGLTGIVTAAVLETAGRDDKAKHDPHLWENPIRYGLAPFISGLSVETVTYNRRVRGVDIATEFLNILMNTVTDAGSALSGFNKFLESQGETMRLQGEDTQEGYQYACMGMVHEVFQLQNGEWIYLPKFRAYFTSFTRRTFKINAGCLSYDEYDFDFKVEKMVAPFKIDMWRSYRWFRDSVDDFIKDLTGAKIDDSKNYLKGIFASKPA